MYPCSIEGADDALVALCMADELHYPCLAHWSLIKLQALTEFPDVVDAAGFSMRASCIPAYLLAFRLLLENCSDAAAYQLIRCTLVLRHSLVLGWCRCWGEGESLLALCALHHPTNRPSETGLSEQRSDLAWHGNINIRCIQRRTQKRGFEGSTWSML